MRDGVITEAVRRRKVTCGRLCENRSRDFLLLSLPNEDRFANLVKRSLVNRWIFDHFLI